MGSVFRKQSGKVRSFKACTRTSANHDKSIIKLSSSSKCSVAKAHYVSFSWICRIASLRNAWVANLQVGIEVRMMQDFLH